MLVHTLLLLGHFEQFSDEEMIYGGLAKDLTEGLIVDWTRYRGQLREGGPIFFGLWTYPFFRVLGPTLFALRVASLVLLALGMWPWVDLARRIAGPTAAVFMGLCMLLPFPSFLRLVLSANAMPTHLGTLMFAGAGLWFLHRGFADHTLGQTKAALGAGLTLGVGCFWAISFWPLAAGYLAVGWLLRVPRRAWLLGVAAVTPGLIAAWRLCFSPLARSMGKDPVAAITAGEFSAIVMEQNTELLTPLTAANLAAELWATVTDHFVRLAGFVPAGAPNTELAAHPSWLYYALFIAATALAVTLYRRGHRAELTRLLALCPPAATYLLGYFVSGVYASKTGGFDRYRYFVPLVPFAWLLIATALAQLPRVWRPPRGAVVIALLALGIVSAANVFSPSVVPTPYRHMVGHNISYLFGDDCGPHQRGLARAGRSDFAALAFGLGACTAMQGTRSAWTDDGRVDGLHEALWPDFWEGYGRGFHQRMNDGATHAAQLRRRIAQGPESRTRAVFRGWCIAAAGYECPSTGEVIESVQAALDGVDDEILSTALDGVFEGMGIAFVLYSLDPREVPEPIAERFRHFYMRGVAQGMARLTSAAAPWPDAAPMPQPLDELESQDWTPPEFRSWIHQEQDRLQGVREDLREVAPRPAR